MGSRRQFTPGATTDRSLESLLTKSQTAEVAPSITGQRHTTRQKTAISLQGPEALEQRQLMTHLETVITPLALDFSSYPNGTIASGTRATLPTVGPTELVSGDHVNPVVISNGAFTPRPGVIRENLMVRFINGNQSIESVTISPVGSGANNTFVWTLTTQGVEKFIAAPAGGGTVRIADSVGYIAVVPGPGSNYAINNITINNTTQRLVYDSPAEENQAVQDVTSSYTNLLGLATNRAITSSEIHANIVGLGSNTTTLTNRQTAVATLQAAVSTTRNQSKNSANIEALQLLESNLQAYAAPLAARYSILHPSHLENYQEDVSNNFSTFPSGSIPSGTNATLANFGKTEVVSGNHVQNVRIVDGKLSSLPGTIAENLMVHFLDDNQLVTSVTVGATSQANSSKLWVMTKNNVETFIPMPAAGGVIAVNKNVSFIAVVPGPGGVYSIDSITTTVTKQRVVYDAVNPFDVDDIDGCSALISTQLDAYTTFCQSPDIVPGLQENDGHGILALDRLSARLEKLTALLDQQTRLMALVGTTPSQSQLAAAATNNDRLSSFNDTWQHDNRALQYRLTGILTDEGRMNDMRTTVLPAMVGPASQGEVASLSTGVPELGGTLTISALRSGTSSPATFTSSYQNVITSGRLTTIDLSSVASTVTNVSFTLAASKPTTVTFLRGETVLSAQLVSPGSIASYGDESGITGVIIEHALTPLSQLAQDALHDINYGKTRLERIWDLRENRNEQHDTLVEQMNSYLDQKGISLPSAERTALLAELVQGGPLASGVTVSNLALEGLQGYSLLENTGGLRIASNGVLAAMAGKIESADNPYDMSIANNSSIYFPRGGDVVRNPMGWYMQVPNQNAYTRFDVHGPAEIGGVFYSGSNSWQALSADYYEILGQSIIVKPGAPAGVIINIRSCSGVYNITTKSGSQQRESVTPPQELTIATDYQGVFTQPIENPGFTPGIVDTSGMKPQRVMLANGLMVMKFENIGQAGGTIRTEIYTGYASNVRAQKIGDFTTAVSPNVPVTLKANVSSPNIPSTGNEPAIITIVTTLPNGQEKVDTIAVNRTGNQAMVVKRGKEVPRPYSEEEQRRLVSAERKIAEAMKNIDPSINIATLQQRYAVLYDLFGSSTAIAKQTNIPAAATNKVADPTTAPPSSGVALFALNEEAERVQNSLSNLAGQLEAMPYMQLIFSKLSLPMDNTNGLLYVQEGSPDHVELEQNAVDFNLRGSANVEIGKPIKAMADGMVVEYNEQEGRIVMRHEVVDPNSDQTIVFFTEFGHMQNIDPSIVGKTLKAGDIIGQAGKIDTPTSNIHVNLIWSPLSENSDFASLDLRPWLKQKGIAIEAPKPGSVRNIGGPSLSLLDVESMQKSGALNVLNGNWNLVRTNGMQSYFSQTPLANEGLTILSGKSATTIEALLGAQRTVLAQELAASLKDILFGDVLGIHDIFDGIIYAVDQQLKELKISYDTSIGLEKIAFGEAIGVYTFIKFDLQTLKLLAPTNALDVALYFFGGKILTAGGKYILLNQARIIGAEASIAFITKLTKQVAKVGSYDVGALLKNVTQSIVKKTPGQTPEGILGAAKGATQFADDAVSAGVRMGEKIARLLDENDIQKMLNHVFKPDFIADYAGKSKVTGIHTIHAIDGVKVKILKEFPKAANGVRKVSLQITDDAGKIFTKESTLFPDNWTPADIENALRYLNGLSKGIPEKGELIGVWKNVSLVAKKFSSTFYPKY